MDLMQYTKKIAPKYGFKINEEKEGTLTLEKRDIKFSFREDVEMQNKLYTHVNPVYCQSHVRTLLELDGYQPDCWDVWVAACTIHGDMGHHISLKNEGDRWADIVLNDVLDQYGDPVKIFVRQNLSITIHYGGSTIYFLQSSGDYKGTVAENIRAAMNWIYDKKGYKPVTQNA